MKRDRQKVSQQSTLMMKKLIIMFWFGELFTARIVYFLSEAAHEKRTKTLAVPSCHAEGEPG